MKCYNHPKEDAVAECKSCGKSVCKDCAIVLSGNSYCKTCIEEGKVNVILAAFLKQQFVAPKPSGTPSRTPFIIGGIGGIIAGVAGILSMFTGIASMLYWGTFGMLLGVAAIPVSVFLGVGIVLTGFGYKGMKTNYGLGIGTAGFILSILTAALFFVTAVLGVAGGSYYYGYYFYSRWYAVFIAFWWISVVMFGATQIVYGVAHIVCRRFTGYSALGLATGILLVISGAFAGTVLLSFVGMLMVLVGGILSLMVFIIAKIPR
jgi:hypothetical protein